MPLAHWRFGYDDTKAPIVLGDYEGKNPSIWFSINEIVHIASLAFVPTLVDNAASLKTVGQQTFYLPIGRFPQFTFFDVGADDDVQLQSLLVAFFHVIHELRGRFEGWFVEKVVVVAEGGRTHKEDSQETQE